MNDVVISGTTEKNRAHACWLNRIILTFPTVHHDISYQFELMTVDIVESQVHTILTWC